MGIKVHGGRSGVTRVVSYLGYPGLSGRENFMDESSLVPYRAALPVAVSCSW